MSKLIPLVTMLATLSLVPSADAHYVWLERDGDGSARVYFGEWINDIREKTGGLLDRIKAPRVFLGASPEPLRVKRHENNLEIAVMDEKAGGGNENFTRTRHISSLSFVRQRGNRWSDKIISR